MVGRVSGHGDRLSHFGNIRFAAGTLRFATNFQAGPQRDEVDGAAVVDQPATMPQDGFVSRVVEMLRPDDVPHFGQPPRIKDDGA
jgi:hypothetical protein